MAKCLRCGAGAEWIEGRSPRCDKLHDVDAEEIDRLQSKLSKAIALLREVDQQGWAVGFKERMEALSAGDSDHQ